MRKFVLLMLLFFVGMVSAVPATEVSYFYSVGCSHCEAVSESGILENLSLIEGVLVDKFEATSPVYREKYLDYLDKFGVSNGGIPFLVIERGGEFSYLMGDSPIIGDAVDSVLDFRAFDDGGVDIVVRDIGLWVVVGAALIDSVNPCAFGVLLFLMAVLLSMGMSRLLWFRLMIVLEATSPYSQRNVSRLGFERVGEIFYDDFVYEGKKVFAGICEASSCMLMELGL